ncbi:MAG: hypothetical protein KGV44_03675 [Flavobacteriaceae bacterium]|nr:hypothetical protein [Flavobacteriaceae bacterium]
MKNLSMVATYSVAFFMAVSLLSSCGVKPQKQLTAEGVRNKIQQERLKKRLKTFEDAIEKEEEEFNQKIKKFKDENWQSQGANSIRWSLTEHQLKRGEEGYKSFVGTAEQGFTQSQAISMAQANAFGQFTRDIASVVQSNLDKIDINNKIGKEEGKAKHYKSAEFKKEVHQNATSVVGPYLEKSYVFTRKVNDDNWSAEVAYLYNTKQDLDIVKAVLEKMLKNTKLYTAEKLWLKKAIEELKK